MTWQHRTVFSTSECYVGHQVTSLRRNAPGLLQGLAFLLVQLSDDLAAWPTLSVDAGLQRSASSGPCAVPKLGQH